MFRALLSVLALPCLFASMVTECAAIDALHQRAQEGAKKAVQIIDRTSAAFLSARKCFSCHTQTFAVMVLADARNAGIKINEENFKAQIERSFEVHDSLPGVRPDTVGHALLTLDIGQYPPNKKTEEMVHYLLEYGKERGHWKVAINDREPAEASDFATNFLAVRGTRRYSTPALEQAIATRRKAVETWFGSAEVKDTEDQVFRLLLADELKIAAKTKDQFVQTLLNEQRSNGGWAQKSGMETDAYATASALVALNKVGGVSAGNAKWQSGVEHLLNTQDRDGSWHVVSRVKPVQEYFESGFPHGKDQFISAFATGWAAEALLILIKSEK